MEQTRMLKNSIRKNIIEQFNGKCAICGFSVSTILKIHHILPVSEGGDNSTKNLVALCPNCHDLVHRFASLSRFSTGRETMLHFGIPTHVADKIMEYASCMAHKSSIRSLVMNQELPNPKMGNTRNLPTLKEAIQIVIKNIKLDKLQEKYFSEAVTLLYKNIPNEIIQSKQISFRLTHKNCAIGSNFMNYLLFRAPALPDRAKNANGANDIFIIIPRQGITLFPNHRLAFEYSKFPAIMIWLTYLEVTKMTKPQIEAYQNGCLLATKAQRSRIWPSTIKL